MPWHGKTAAAKSGGMLVAPLRRAGLWHMGYIIALVLLLLVVPLIFMVITRRSSSAGGLKSRNRGMTVDKPSSDQPTPPAGPRTDRPHMGSDRGVPPG